MPPFLQASTASSLDGLIRSELWFDVVKNGTYVHPRSGETLDRYDLTGYTVRHVAGRRMTRKEQGIHRVEFADAMNVSGRRKEFMDKAGELITYSLTKAEQAAIRSLYPSGIPGTFQLGWEREIHGPMSPTIEQSVMYAKHDAGADGTTLTIVNPTSGNLLALTHGYYWRGTTLGDATATGAGGTTFTNRGQAGSANFENYQCIMDRISNGAEGTTITVTNGGVSQENSGGFFEVSGMEASPFVAISAGADGGTGTVTTIGTGDVDTTGTDNTWLLAAFGTEDVISSRTYDPTSFVEAGTIQGAGDSDHGTSVALRTVSAAGTYACAMSWTTACTASGIVAAYEITVAPPPVNTVPDDTLGIFVTSDEPTQISATSPSTAISVVDAAGLTTCRVYCTSGDLTVTLSGSVVISSGANGSSDLTLGSGASTAEFNTVLATLTYQGDTDFHGTDTINVVSTGTGGSDTDTFNVLNDPRILTLTVTTSYFASLVTATGTAQVRLDPGRQSGSCAVLATDDDTLPDSQTLLLQVAQTESVFPYRNLAVPTARRDRR